jgi:pleiotropic regulator 1
MPNINYCFHFHPAHVVHIFKVLIQSMLTGDNGSLWFWDYKSGHNYQQAQTIVQPGSLDSEAGIYALSYDITGSRLITCEADKTIKFWKEDEKATPETHPIHFKPPKDMRRF